MKPPHLLLVEDEDAQRRLLQDILTKEGLAVKAAANGKEAIAALEVETPDIILCDWKMPHMTGGEVLQHVRKNGIPCAFIVMTAYGSISHAVEALRTGADDYLSKPFEREALLIAIRRVIKTQALERENSRLKQELHTQAAGFGGIVGKSEPMQRLYRTLHKVAATDATVLLIGESGTGKELFARTLHQHSARANAVFVAVNCAAIPETLMESEFFGHEKGAFTGAAKRREGKFEEAAGGTLFLDEIASMPLPLQATLLRVLQEKRFTRLGGKGEVECDARIIAASNRDLTRLVSAGEFREDLYYRLNVVPIRIPPLRERKEDIPALCAALLQKAQNQHKTSIAPLPSSVLRILMEWSWPGNVRELANLMERLILLAEDGKIRAEDLPDEMRHPAPAPGCPFQLPPAGLVWDELEKSLLQQALERAAGNRTVAARILGLPYKAFLYRLEKFGLV